jgi:hypothetical protein
MLNSSAPAMVPTPPAERLLFIFSVARRKKHADTIG